MFNLLKIWNISEFRKSVGYDPMMFIFWAQNRFLEIFQNIHTEGDTRMCTHTYTYTKGGREGGKERQTGSEGDGLFKDIWLQI